MFINCLLGGAAYEGLRSQDVRGSVRLQVRRTTGRLEQDAAPLRSIWRSTTRAAVVPDFGCSVRGPARAPAEASPHAAAAARARSSGGTSREATTRRRDRAPW